ncbi:hypothetical protein [Litoribrevibacter albus]|nr:hypothetical protein [Litoribrevibacter albus]
MQQPLVGVVHRSPSSGDLSMKHGRLSAIVFGFVLPGFLFTQGGYSDPLESHKISYAENDQGLYVAKVQLHTPEELKELFDRAESFLDTNQSYLGSSPIEVVLHGPEVRVFQRKNYQQYKMLVDQAARLDAYKIIDVRICEVWMSVDNVQHSELPPFVDTVPNGPEYQEELIEKGYSLF